MISKMFIENKIKIIYNEEINKYEVSKNNDIQKVEKQSYPKASGSNRQS